MSADSPLTHVVDISDASQIGAARRLAARLGEGVCLPAMVASNAAIVVMELAGNLLKHAQRGQILLQAHGSGDRAALVVLAIDRGPGMDLERCFRDGFSTAGTAGTGLGAVRRLAQEFDAWSDAGGSVLFARIGAADALCFGVIAVALRGEVVSGDSWRLEGSAEGWTAAIADGLGHGELALRASRLAVWALSHAAQDPAAAMQAAHARCSGSRGSAATMVRFDRGHRRLLHAGVGNVSAMLIQREGARALMPQNGTLGAVLPRIQTAQTDAVGVLLLVLHSDGIGSRWSLDTYPGLRTRHPQLVAAVLYRDALRGRDDATILVVRL